MSLPICTKSTNQEGLILLAIQAIKSGQSTSRRAVAELYSIPEPTLYWHIRRIALQYNSISNSQKLTL